VAMQHIGETVSSVSGRHNSGIFAQQYQ